MCCTALSICDVQSRIVFSSLKILEVLSVNEKSA